MARESLHAGDTAGVGKARSPSRDEVSARYGEAVRGDGARAVAIPERRVCCRIAGTSVAHLVRG